MTASFYVDIGVTVAQIKEQCLKVLFSIPRLTHSSMVNTYAAGFSQPAIFTH